MLSKQYNVVVDENPPSQEKCEISVQKIKKDLKYKSQEKHQLRYISSETNDSHSHKSQQNLLQPCLESTFQNNKNKLKIKSKNKKKWFDDYLFDKNNTKLKQTIDKEIRHNKQILDLCYSMEFSRTKICQLCNSSKSENIKTSASKCFEIWFQEKPRSNEEVVVVLKRINSPMLANEFLLSELFQLCNL